MSHALILVADFILILASWEFMLQSRMATGRSVQLLQAAGVQTAFKKMCLK